jgi:hypothetical protein
MTDPATGTAAGTTAIAVTTGTMFGLGKIMPAGASFNEFVWGCIFAIAGAFAFEFIKAQAARQKAAEANIPIADRPKIDITMLGYAMCGAPMAAACLIYLVHALGGATGFGDTTWLQSVVGYMVAGAAGPQLVFKVVGALIALAGSIKITGGNAE